ncbi:hypothetical protein Rhopal_005266-T1 [Rhodotorula paludigena]|uniref:Uncharacterized protein n=1 Tax=Rhodotorula paludigena TaxID=86838 RepID=A0AAV5GHV0_9BASI|nr:hypothetical protein Rhopal_005266-T1 [Rhodotorula paludigena]
MPPAAARDATHAEGQHALGIAPGPAPRPVGSSAPLARSVSGGHIAGPGAGGFAGAGTAGAARAGHARQHSAGSVSAAAAGPQPVLLRPPLMRPSASATSPPAASFPGGQHWSGPAQVPQGAAPSVGSSGRRKSSGAHHLPKQQPQQPPQPPQLDEADPRSWSVASMRIRSDFFIKLLKDLSQKGAFQIELELQMTETMPRLQRVGLPVTPETLAQYAPDMVVLPGCAPKHYLQAFDLWRNWTYRLDVTTFPICGSLVVSFLLDCVPEADRRRTVELLELYRRSTIIGFLPNPHRPRAAFKVPKMSATDWTSWDSASASASAAAAPPPAVPSERALGKRRAHDEPASSGLATAQTLEQQRREADFAAAQRAAAAATETNARAAAAVASAQVPSGDAVFQQQLQRLGAKAAPVAPVAVQPAPAQRQQPAPVAIAPQPTAAVPVHPKPSQRPSKRPRKSAHLSEAARLALAEQREDTDFWHAAAGIDAALAKLAAAQVEHAQRVPPVDSPLHAVWKERLEASRASPWVNGQAPPPSTAADEAPLKPTSPYGDFVPSCVPVDFARAPELLRDPVTRDPLDVLRPFPGYPPPPYIGRTTAVPCPPTEAEAAHPPVQLTPAPFLPYPDALRPLTDATRAKTFTFAAELVQHVDKKIPRGADGAEGALPAGDALERARKDALVKLLRDSFLAGKMTALPEVAEPEQAQKSRRLVSKFKRRERKRAKKAKKAEKAAAAAAGKAMAEEKEDVLDLVDSEEDPARGAAEKDEQAMQVDEPAVDEADEAVLSEKAKAPAASTPALPAKAATHPPRPSLAASSAASAPAVPSARPRAKSNTMHRRPSVSGPNVHPLAQIYASQPEALRHLMRGKAADIRGIPSDARANALAAVTAQLSPATRTVGLRTPRLSHAGSPMLNSPPLVPLPEHKAVGGDVDMLDLGKSRGGTAEPALPTGVTALGVTLESPAETSAAPQPAAAAPGDKPARASPVESRDPSTTFDNNVPPSAVIASSTSSPATERPASSVAVGGAVAAVARAVRPASVDRARSASAPGPSVEASTPLAMKAARRPRHCKRCGRNDCPGRGKRELCVHADELSSRASVVSTVESVAAGGDKGKGRAESDDEDEPVAVPAKRGRFEPASGTHLRPHPLRNIPHHWLAASMPYRPFDPRPTGPKRQKAS